MNNCYLFFLIIIAHMSNIHKRIRFVKLMVHWYQWYDWYQWKSTLFQWFYWWLCISLRGLRLFSHVVWLGAGQFRWSIGTNGTNRKAPYSNGSIGTNGTIGTNGKPPYSNGSIGEYASHWGELDYFLMWSGCITDGFNRKISIQPSTYVCWCVELWRCSMCVDRSHSRDQ